MKHSTARKHDVIDRARSLSDQDASEIQPFGTIVKLPIALAADVCKTSVENVSQLIADKTTLPDIYKKQIAGPTLYQMHLLYDKHPAEQSQLVDYLAERIQSQHGISVAMADDVAEMTLMTTPDRVAMLDLLASQAAISLENAHLYSDLQRSQAFLAEGQSISHTGSFGWSVASGKIFWSEETFRIFEYGRTTTPTVELVLQRVHPEDVPFVRETIERVSQDGQDCSIAYRLRMPDGRIKYLEVVAHASRDESYNLEFLGAVMDVTERKLAEAERERLGQRLRQVDKMEAIGRLAGGIAHDFNNVLGGIFAYGEMLFEKAPADSPLKHYAQNVLTATARGRALVDQILAYSRSQRSRRTPIDIGRTVAEALELVRGSLPANICLEASTPKLPLVVMGDATQLHQIVMNLCTNAIQAMGAGGPLHVALDATELSTERVLSHGTLRPGRYVRLSVEDRGSGMDEATLARIFEPFFTTKDIGRGTGLGLSLVDAIVTDLSGAIDVRSMLTQGSTFAIYLPLAHIARLLPLRRAGCHH